MKTSEMFIFRTKIFMRVISDVKVHNVQLIRIKLELELELATVPIKHNTSKTAARFTC